MAGGVLAVFAHPDDESYLCAGLMARAVQAGDRVVCITATRGELGSPDEEQWPPGAPLAAVRTAEMEAALAVLGITEHHWLDYPDGGCADVDQEVAVDDELPRLCAGRGEAEAVDDVVEPPLQGDQQLFAGAATPPVGRRDVAPELLLADAVVALGELLGAQLRAEDRGLVGAPLAVLAVCGVAIGGYLLLGYPFGPILLTGPVAAVAVATRVPWRTAALAGTAFVLVTALPHALDNDQLANANALALAGGAVVTPQDRFTASSLADELSVRLSAPAELAASAAAARAVGKPDAAARLADLVLAARRHRP